MPRGVGKLSLKKTQGAAQSVPQAERKMTFRLTRRGLSIALMVLALGYAFLAGLHTVTDLDMGWHLATGRYVIQHHAVPSTDILSYTSPGAEWIYPPFAGVLLYGIYSAWGYAGLSWFCALALVAMVACVLRSPSRQESGFAAALAILAVPELALRASPRADLFTTLFFAIFLAQLWSFHRSSADLGADPDHVENTAAGHRLWVLPLLMLLWVNLHPGFIAGLGLLFAYLLIECMELPLPSRRRAALERLKMAWKPLVATVLATLFNPYGPRIFKASLALANFQPTTNQPSRGVSIGELTSVPLSVHRLAEALDWRDPASSYWWLALAAVVLIILACWRKRFGGALLMTAALYASVQHLRYQGLFSVVTVVVGSTILAEAFASRRDGNSRVDAKRSGLLRLLLAIGACALCVLTCVRIVDLTSSRFYTVTNSAVLFGPGESWWFPERAAAFISREHLSGNIFQGYNLGGFTAWRLGPGYGDFIDGRNVDPAVWTEYQRLMSSPPDSSVWETESSRRNINILLFSLARTYDDLGPLDLMSLCQSHLWRPVYMDEVSIVLLRNRPENRPWIDKYEVNCRSQNFTPAPLASRRELSNFYANAGTVLFLLGRQSEAIETLVRGAALSPEDPSIHFALAQLYAAQQRPGDAEREFKVTLSLKGEDAGNWFALGRFYASHGRYADARPFVLTAIQLSATPIEEYIQLGFIDVALQQPQEALADFAKAEETCTGLHGSRDIDPEAFATMLEGRALAYFGLGERQRAIALQQEAIRKAPKNPGHWEVLAILYEKDGQMQLAEQARQQAGALPK